MNYTSLCTNIQDICENTFTSDQLAMFAQQAEQKIYASVQIPALRETATGALTPSSQYFSLPADFLHAYSFAVVDGSGEFHFLLNKDVNFIREAYPKPSTTGLPQHYAYFDENTFILGPTPNAVYTMELHYGYYPESIVTASTTWLGTNFQEVLLYGSIREAYLYLKGEDDLAQKYEAMYQEALGRLKQLGDGKNRQDAYRSGQVRVPVK